MDFKNGFKGTVVIILLLAVPFHFLFLLLRFGVVSGVCMLRVVDYIFFKE